MDAWTIFGTTHFAAKAMQITLAEVETHKGLYPSEVAQAMHEIATKAAISQAPQGARFHEGGKEPCINSSIFS